MSRKKKTKYDQATEAKRRSREAFGQVQRTKRIPSKRRSKMYREIEKEVERQLQGE